MRVLTIGRSGQVARSLLEHGAARGIDVIAAGRPQTDLLDAANLARTLDEARSDVVINAAAHTAVDKAESEEDAANALNADGPAALARLCAERGVPLIHISTDYVFDGTLDRPYREDDPIAPKSAYGRSKAGGEAGVRAAGGPSLIARTAWVYSPFGGNFVKTMLRLGAERDHLRIVGDQVGNPTSALDIADALLTLSERASDWPDGSTTVHLTAQGEASWYDFACAIFDAAGLSPKVDSIATRDYPTPAARPANSRLDCTHLAERFGITLPHWRESLPPVVARIRDAPQG